MAYNGIGLGVVGDYMHYAWFQHKCSLKADSLVWHYRPYYAKPVLYEGGISRTILSSKHVKEKRKNERGKF